MTDAAVVPDDEDDFDPDFDGFAEDSENPESNKAAVPDGVEEVPQDPDWKPEGV